MRQKHEYYVDADESCGDDVTEWIHGRVYRRDFTQPGFVLINLLSIHDSRQLRREMVQLKKRLDVIHRTRTGKHLVYTSMGRYDQQVTTKPHRDGGPDETVLMLGYEPTSVHSRLYMADYSKCAFDLGLDPKKFLQIHNPMFADGERMLAGYTTQVEGIDAANYQILVVNNSCVPFREDCQALLGVLHQAVIENPTVDATRIVNSTMIACVDSDLTKAITPDEQEDFLTTDGISKPLYK